ncbi:MAG TPA: uracil-DNA glycosylase [Candidatus Paceibacterota bacterium]|jgi:uracil-DNA glycosylase, family 4
MTVNTEAMREIRDEIFALKNSSLYAYRTENNYFPVIGEGAHDAHLMFVGEAPGQNEAKKGKPFCGASGRFLDEMLASIKMDRTKVYVTNLVKDRPPENRDPSPDEIQLYGPFLERQIEIMKPKVIATLGRHSMKYLFEKYGLTDKLQTVSKIHGKEFKATAPWGTFTIVALYHPAVALYNGGMRQVLLEDFKALEKYK